MTLTCALIQESKLSAADNVLVKMFAKQLRGMNVESTLINLRGKKRQSVTHTRLMMRRWWWW